LRAFVNIVGVNQAIVPDKDNKPAFYFFQPVFQNYGSTRTATFTAWASIKYFDGGVPNNQDLTKPFSKINPSNTIIGQNGIYPMQPVDITAEEQGKIIAKQGVGLLWGHADFADIFNPATIHPISFCYLLNPIQATNGQIVLQPIPYRPECNSNI
jgi:hypothetical protein